MGIRRKITRPAIFLDRDGVLNPTVFNPATGRMESPLTPRDFHLCDGVIPALLRLQSAGYPLILVSNQPNFALGKTSYLTHRTIRHKLETQLDSAGVRFTRFCYCLHHPKGVTPGYSDVCRCRKPSPGFLMQARDDFGLTLSDSWMIGDQPTDTQCARAAGVRSIRITGSIPHDPRTGVRQSDATPPPLAFSLAAVLAQHGSPVLFVDADLRSAPPASASGDPGLSEMLAGNAVLPFTQSIAGLPLLSVVHAGARPPLPPELIASSRMTGLLAAWRDEFSFIVIHSPAAVFADALVLAQLSDAVLMTARAGETKRDEVLPAYHALSRQVPDHAVLGVILESAPPGVACAHA